MIDFRGLKIKEGDRLKVTVCKDVVVRGKVVFHDAAYCLKYYYGGADRIASLTSYSHSCIFEIINK